jgi:hypothetical protein
VIVGKQSVGKSSLLASLTDIPFPVGDNLCTRFATRIVSIRTDPGTTNEVQVSIEPGDVNTFNELDNNEGETSKFSQTIKSTTAQEFNEITKRVCRA